jgi:hypothetical protein
MSYWNTIMQLLYMKFCEYKVLNLLGKWKKSKYFGQTIPVSGLTYYVTAPPTWVCIRIHFF